MNLLAVGITEQLYFVLNGACTVFDFELYSYAVISYNPLGQFSRCIGRSVEYSHVFTPSENAQRKFVVTYRNVLIKAQFFKECSIDKAWIFTYDPKTKLQSVHWKTKAKKTAHEFFEL